MKKPHFLVIAFLILFAHSMRAQKEGKSLVTMDSIYFQNQLLIKKIERIEKYMSISSVDAGKCESDLKKVNAEKAILQGDLMEAKRQLEQGQRQWNEMSLQFKSFQGIIENSDSRLSHEIALRFRKSEFTGSKKLVALIEASLCMDEVDSLLKLAPNSEVRMALSKLSSKMESLAGQFSSHSSIYHDLSTYTKRVNGYCSNLKVFSDFVKGVSDSWVTEVIADYFLELKTDFSPYPFLYQAQMGALGIGPGKYFNAYLWMKSNPIDCK